MEKKYMLIFGSLSICLIILMIMLLKNVDQKVDPYDEFPNDKSIDMDESFEMQVAEENLEFASGLKADKGYYLLIDSDGVKTDPVNPVASLVWSMLAHSSILKSTKDIAYLEIIEDEFENMESLILNEGWHLDPVVPTLYAAYLNLEGIDEVGYLRDRMYNWIYLTGIQVRNVYLPDDEPLMMLGIISRSAAISHNILSDNSYEHKFEGIDQDVAGLRDEADEAMRYSIYLIDYAETESESVGIDDGGCWLQLAKIEVYKGDGGQRYLDEVENYFADIDFKEDLISDDPGMIPMSIEPCAESMIILYELTGNDSYREKFLEIMGYIEDEYIDMEGKEEEMEQVVSCRQFDSDVIEYRHSEICYAAYLYSDDIFKEKGI